MPHTNDLSKAHRIYLMGICGTAMASLAGMLQERGYHVAGSDEHVYPPMSTYLDQLGISILEGYTTEHLETFRPDLVVVGNAISRNNPEAVAVVERDLPYTSMPEAIFELFIRGHHSIVVAGTHGKTTTTSLMAWVLESAGRDPGFVVGGIPLNFGSNFKLGSGVHFVIEGDEYNTAFFDRGPKFLHYGANTLLVNNIEFDHGDIFDGIDDIVEAFRSVVKRIAPGDAIVANGDDLLVMGLRREARKEDGEARSEDGEARSEDGKGGDIPASVEWLTFGLGPDCLARATNFEMGEEWTSFDTTWDGKPWVRIESPLSGLHNVLNALAVMTIARRLGLAGAEIQKGIRSFQGVKRRMEVRGVECGVTVIDDFAHHPTAVKTTLAGARKKHPGHRIWGIFEPRSISSSRKEFEEPYVEAFAVVDRIIIGPIFHRERYETRYGIEKMMSASSIVEALRSKGGEADHITDFDRIAELVARDAKDGDIVIVMSSGAAGGVHEKILEALRSRGGAAS